jgi:hypothetical protein
VNAVGAASSKRRLFERQGAGSTDKANDNIPAANDIHCDNDTTARDASHRSRVHNKASKGLSITWATCTARHTTKVSEHQTLSTDDIKATFKKATTKAMRLRGSGGETQEELDALETLSQNGCATFKSVMRKLIVMTYNEGIGITDVLDNYTLQKINAEVNDEEVGDAVWDSYGAYLCWAEDDDDDQQYYESENDDDDDDEYYDADEWSEGQILVGSLKIWNEDRNYGVIVVVDDYTTRDFQEGEIFCHGTNFLDEDDGTYVEDQLVWFTVTWDDTRGRWQAVDINLATVEHYTAFEEKNNMSPEASMLFIDQVIGQAYDGI